jgi:NAD(P)-dependent dehydrogenase (short-subunit alcohol dehydrogenase family)
MVNSAAGFTRTPLLAIDFAEWQSVLGVNLTGPFLCMQHAARLMIEGGSGGAIINISDNSGLKPWAARPAHSVSKAGVIMLTQVSALNLAAHNIRVNCVVPGPVLRPAGEPEEVLDQIARMLPLKHIGEPATLRAPASSWQPTTLPLGRFCASMAARGWLVARPNVVRRYTDVSCNPAHFRTFNRRAWRLGRAHLRRGGRAARPDGATRARATSGRNRCGAGRRSGADRAGQYHGCG